MPSLHMTLDEAAMLALLEADPAFDLAELYAADWAYASWAGIWADTLGFAASALSYGTPLTVTATGRRVTLVVEPERTATGPTGLRVEVWDKASGDVMATLLYSAPIAERPWRVLTGSFADLIADAAHLLRTVVADFNAATL